MRNWPVHPVIYEINTCVWLGELSRTYKRVRGVLYQCIGEQRCLPGIARGRESAESGG